MTAFPALQISMADFPLSMILHTKPTQKQSSILVISVSSVSDLHLHLPSIFLPSDTFVLPGEQQPGESQRPHPPPPHNVLSLIATAQRHHLLSLDNTPQTIRSTADISLISEFTLLLSGQIKLQIPLFSVWSACDGVVIPAEFRTSA